jgi:hypothetical protein
MPKEGARPARRKGTKQSRASIIAEQMEQQRQAFVAKFGREPGPGDPILFDPDQDTPQRIPESKLNAGMTISMIRAGIPHHLIYAYIRTGLMLTAAQLRKASTKDRTDWEQAMREYERDFGD